MAESRTGTKRSWNCATRTPQSQSGTQRFLPGVSDRWPRFACTPDAGQRGRIDVFRTLAEQAACSRSSSYPAGGGRTPQPDGDQVLLESVVVLEVVVVVVLVLVVVVVVSVEAPAPLPRSLAAATTHWLYGVPFMPATCFLLSLAHT